MLETQITVLIPIFLHKPLKSVFLRLILHKCHFTKKWSDLDLTHWMKNKISFDSHKILELIHLPIQGEFIEINNFTKKIINHRKPKFSMNSEIVHDKKISWFQERYIIAHVSESYSNFVEFYHVSFSLTKTKLIDVFFW